MNKKRILVVDDEAPFARLLKLNLEKTERYDVRVEVWPEDAVSAAREFKPHMVFLDIMMPRMPGGNVAAAFKADPELKDIPIVWLTAAIRPSQIAESGGKICDYPCLPKPPNMDDIIKYIETYALAD